MFATYQPIKHKTILGKYQFVKYIERKVIVSPHTGHTTIQDCEVLHLASGTRCIANSGDFVAYR